MPMAAMERCSTGDFTFFDDLKFQSKPLCTGNPWFMPLLLNWHRLADKLGI
jgi:hypothetical protein